MRAKWALWGACFWMCACGQDRDTDLKTRAFDLSGDVTRVEFAPLNEESVAVLVTRAGEPGGEMTWRLGEETLVLYDHGEGLDVAAEDGVYTGQGPMDVEAYLGARQARRDAISESGSGHAMSFSGRAATGVYDFSTEHFDALTSVTTLAGIGEVQTFQVFPPTTIAAPTNNVAVAPSVTSPQNSLVITETEVVRDRHRTAAWSMVNGVCQPTGNPMGVWSFAHLMQEASAPISGVTVAGQEGDVFVTEWLNTYMATRTPTQANPLGQTIPGSTGGVHNIINYNLAGSTSGPRWGNSPHYPPTPEVFDRRESPFELIAIVNRLDLAASDYGGGGASGGGLFSGELRFVFALIDRNTCEPMNATVIFEYDVTKGCADTERWAQDWSALSQMTLGTPGYRSALEQLTEPIVRSGAGVDRPNASNLKQLRVNEQNFRHGHYGATQWPTQGKGAWEFQQWSINPDTGLLHNTPLENTPDFRLELPNWAVGPFGPQPIDQHLDALVSNPSTAPLPSGFFLPYGPVANDGLVLLPGIYTLADFPPGTILWPSGPLIQMFRGTHWGSPHMSQAALEEVRQPFSLNTCNGCHYSEAFEDGEGSSLFYGVNPGTSTPGATAEPPFQHVRAAASFAQPAHLSRFLTGTNTTCAPGQEFVQPLGPMPSCVDPRCCPIADPVRGFKKQQFHYNEYARRGAILDEVTLNGCGVLEAFADSPLATAAVH